MFIWIGASKRRYRYFVYTLPRSFDKNQDGNYIYAKKDLNGNWVPIYIGEGNLETHASDRLHQIKCIESKGATHIHAHLRSDEKARKAEEEDFLNNHPDVYAPIGCNEKAIES